jgi:hypothetical protein
VKNTAADPARNATATSWPIVSTPVQAATGTLANKANAAISQASMTGRLRRRSTQAPAGSPMSTAGSHAVACSSPTTRVLECSTSTAVNGIATTAIADPAVLIVSPNQNSRKSRSRHSPDPIIPSLPRRGQWRTGLRRPEHANCGRRHSGPGAAWY